MRSRSVKILVIDEHKEDRVALRRRLTEADDKIRVFEAGGGETALDWFRAVQPDCVVMDLQLKDLVGMEVLNRIFIAMSKQPVPIFIWTRLNQDLVRATASSFGIRGYFHKDDVNDNALVAAIQDAMIDR